MHEPLIEMPDAKERVGATPLSALEVAGAVSARVIHDLSNLISGIVGNAEYAARMSNDPAGLRKAIEAISTSANAAGKLLGQCLPLQHSIATAAFPFDVNEQAAMIAEGSGLMPSWRATLPPAMTGQIKVQPRWLAGAVWQIVRELQVPRGEIEFAVGQAVFPATWSSQIPNRGRPTQLFQILLRYRSEQILVSKETPVTPERPGLLAAFELIKRFKGQLQSRSKPPGRQEISILIPLA